MKVVIDIKEETYNLIRETITFWREGDATVAPIGWQAIADSKPYEERPHGEWIDICTLPIIRKCSICGNKIGNEMGFYNNFCPNCGADMRGKEE